MTKPIPVEKSGLKSPVLERFIRYVKVPTASDGHSMTTPSTRRQFVLARLLRDELTAIGASDVKLLDTCVVMATIPASPGCEDRPVMMLASHMDTSPEAACEPIRPQVALAWDGTPIELPREGVVLSCELFPDLMRHIGEDIICTDGHTLLGADDKAGITAIMTAAVWFLSHPEEPHAEVRILFTPDEEIGRGTAGVDIPSIGAMYGYTIDGDEVGELECETFNAARAYITYRGIAVHPGASKNRMVNSVRLAAEFIRRLPELEAPETTEGREGFIHPCLITGSVDETSIELIIRDHDAAKFEEKKERVRKIALSVPTGRAPAPVIDIRDQYRNMKEYFRGKEEVMDMARAAFADCGVTPIEKPVRGGTDGSFYSEGGIPCPNIFSGGHNYHGIYECIPLQSLEKACEVVRALISHGATFKGWKKEG